MVKPRGRAESSPSPCGEARRGERRQPPAASLSGRPPPPAPQPPSQLGPARPPSWESYVRRRRRSPPGAPAHWGCGTRGRPCRGRFLPLPSPPRPAAARPGPPLCRPALLPTWAGGTITSTGGSLPGSGPRAAVVEAGKAPGPHGLANPGAGYGSEGQCRSPSPSRGAAALEHCAARREKLRAAELEALLSKPLCCGRGFFLPRLP